MAPETTTGALALDDASRTVTVNGVALDLTDPERRVLVALATKPDTVVSKAELSYALYSDKARAAESNVVEVLISRVRKKLKAAGAAGAVETSRGLGYRFTVPQAP